MKKYKIILWLLPVVAMLAINSTYAQTISGMPGPFNCVFPANSCYYEISGYTGGVSDKWCVTGGTINGTTNTCVTSVGSSTINVTWGGMGTGTIFYYKPASSTTPLATFDVSIIGAGPVGFGTPDYEFPFIPKGKFVVMKLTGSDASSCGTPMSYQWQQSNDGGITYTDITGATGKDYNVSGTFTQNLYFKRKVFMSNSSNQVNGYIIVSITVIEPATLGAASPAISTILPNTNAPVITAGAASPGQYEIHQYLWQRSTDNINWTTIEGASGLQYDPGILTETTYFRQKVRSGPLLNYGEPVTVGVLKPGSIAVMGALYAYYNSPASEIAEIISASGGAECANNYAYQWQQSTDGVNFSDIAGAIDGNYIPGNLMTPTHFRRKVSCGSVSIYSNECFIYVAPEFFSGTLTPSVSNVGYNQGNGVVITGTAATGGICNGNAVFQWQKSRDNFVWENASVIIISSTAFNYETGPLTESSWFRRKDVCGQQILYTNSVLVNVTAGLEAGIVGPLNYEVYYGRSPGQLSCSPASGGTGSGYNYQWEGSVDDGVTYQPISGATELTYAPGNITTPARFRVKITDGTNIVYTNACTISIGDPTVNINYVRKREIKIPGKTDYTSANSLVNPFEVTQSTEYLDGLSRPVQTVVKEGAAKSDGQRVDLVSVVVYDDFGRTSRTYLPFAANDVSDGSTLNNGFFRVNPLAEQAVFGDGFNGYQGEKFYYSQAVYEPSPLNRINKQGAPGKDWQPDSNPNSTDDKTVKRSYETNGENEVLNFKYDASSQTVLFGADNKIPPYGPNQLYKNRTLDEHNNETIEYVDKIGRTICKKVQYGTTAGSVKQYASTYYVYDDIGKLVLVLQPEAVKAFEN